MKSLDRRQIIGWVAVALSTMITCFWAFWGIIENFHEGWYFQAWLSNIGLMFVQYLSPMLIFGSLTTFSIFWPRIGGSLHIIFALFAAWFFDAFTNPMMLLLVAPLVGIGLLYWFGRPHPRKVAVTLALGLPLLTLFVSGVEPVLRVSQRVDDGDRQARLVPGNGVELIWAPEGPGWPRIGMSWHAAQRACQYLSADGYINTSSYQGVWRLPTVEETVRSMARRGQNCGGIWDPDLAEASYKTTPDKESPLWNPHSQVIYWWTATEVDVNQALIIVYDGQVWPRSKELSVDYLGFRCVKQPNI